MFQFRLTFIFSFLLLALLTATANAGRHKPTPGCDKCVAKMQRCELTCVTMSEASCRFYCECYTAEADHFCRDSCGMGGPNSACQYFLV